MKHVKRECVCVGLQHPVMVMLLHLHAMSAIINAYVEQLELLPVQRVKRVMAEPACAEQTLVVQ